MSIRHLLAASLLGCALSAQATDVPLAADGSWNPFDVSIDQAPGYNLAWMDIADGSALTFTFTVGAGDIGTLTVVDAVWAGDVFDVKSFGSSLGFTSTAVNTYPAGTNVGYDYDAALADARFSRGVYTFGEGSYAITGVLVSSSVDELGQPLYATNGALKLTVAPVPEPSPLMLLGVGLALLPLLRRHRAP